MTEKTTIDRSMYAYSDAREHAWGTNQLMCPQCNNTGLYLGMESELDEDPKQDGLRVQGSYPIYACDDCKLVWAGPIHRP